MPTWVTEVASDTYWGMRNGVVTSDHIAAWCPRVRWFFAPTCGRRCIIYDLQPALFDCGFVVDGQTCYCQSAWRPGRCRTSREVLQQISPPLVRPAAAAVVSTLSARSRRSGHRGNALFWGHRDIESVVVAQKKTKSRKFSLARMSSSFDCKAWQRNSVRSLGT